MRSIAAKNKGSSDSCWNCLFCRLNIVGYNVAILRRPWSTPRHPIPRFPAVLLQHLHIGDRHPAIHCLAHVVNRQQSDLHGGQRFHLHACAPERFHAYFAKHAWQVFIDGKVYRHSRQCQRMAQRDQIRGSFRALDRGDSRDAEHIALFSLAVANQRKRGGQHDDRTARDGYAARLAFVADIDHVRFARSIEMCKSGHKLSLQRALIITAARGWSRRAHAATISLSSCFRWSVHSVSADGRAPSRRPYSKVCHASKPTSFRRFARWRRTIVRRLYAAAAFAAGLVTNPNLPGTSARSICPSARSRPVAKWNTPPLSSRSAWRENRSRS